MSVNNYECMVIFDSNRFGRDPSKISDRFIGHIESLGGEILVSRLWNEQKLAYPIKGQKKGAYWLTYFRLESDKVVELDRACKLNDDILRNLIIKIDPRLIDTLVAHAKGEALPEDYDESEEGDEERVEDYNEEGEVDEEDQSEDESEEPIAQPSA